MRVCVCVCVCVEHKPTVEENSNGFFFTKKKKNLNFNSSVWTLLENIFSSLLGCQVQGHTTKFGSVK